MNFHTIQGAARYRATPDLPKQVAKALGAGQFPVPGRFGQEGTQDLVVSWMVLEDLDCLRGRETVQLRKLGRVGPSPRSGPGVGSPSCRRTWLRLWSRGDHARSPSGRRGEPSSPRPRTRPSAAASGRGSVDPRRCTPAGSSMRPPQVPPGVPGRARAGWGSRSRRVLRAGPRWIPGGTRTTRRRVSPFKRGVVAGDEEESGRRGYRSQTWLAPK